MARERKPKRGGETPTPTPGEQLLQFLKGVGSVVRGIAGSFGGTSGTGRGLPGSDAFRRGGAVPATPVPSFLERVQAGLAQAAAARSAPPGRPRTTAVPGPGRSPAEQARIVNEVLAGTYVDERRRRAEAESERQRFGNRPVGGQFLTPPRRVPKGRTFFERGR